jgi:hypothetical protein
MGTWQELNIACELKKDVPQEVIDVLNCLATAHRYEDCRHFSSLAHPLFHEEDWAILFFTGCAYFPGATDFTFYFDQHSQTHQLMIRATPKYGGINLFLHWLAQ